MWSWLGSCNYESTGMESLQSLDNPAPGVGEIHVVGHGMCKEHLHQLQTRVTASCNLVGTVVVGDLELLVGHLAGHLVHLPDALGDLLGGDALVPVVLLHPQVLGRYGVGTALQSLADTPYGTELPHSDAR